jgi:hypothetical protein
MTNHRIYTAFFVFLVLLISIFMLLKYYSGQVSIKKDGYYEISTLVKGEYSDAENLKYELNGKIKSQVVIDKISEGKYELSYGKFTDTYNAGSAAFNLFADSLIKNYKIMLDGKPVEDNFSNILLVARDENRTSVHSFNLQEKKTYSIWSDWGEDVISLDQSPNKNICFFVTVDGLGKKGSMSYLNDARLYNFIRMDDRIRMIEYLRNGMQYYSLWNAKNRYMTSFVSLDSATNQNVIQNIAIFDSTGAKVQSMAKTFNLIKDGFPAPPQKKLDYSSNMNKYIVYSEKNEKSGLDIMVKRAYSNEGAKVVNISGSIHDIAWSSDDKYLFLICSDVKQITKKTAKTDYFYLIYDADSKKIIRKFDPADFRAISVYGRIVAVETGYGSESKILFYDYLKNRNYFELSLSGGCAIKNLPLAK